MFIPREKFIELLGENPMNITQLIKRCPFFAVVVTDETFFNSANRLAEIEIAKEFNKPFHVFVLKSVDVKSIPQNNLFGGVNEITFTLVNNIDEARDYYIGLVSEWAKNVFKQVFPPEKLSMTDEQIKNLAKGIVSKFGERDLYLHGI